MALLSLVKFELLNNPWCLGRKTQIPKPEDLQSLGAGEGLCGCLVQALFWDDAAVPKFWSIVSISVIAILSYW